MQDETVIADQRLTTNDPNSVLISIIIPAYNTSHYIHRAIESSQRQSHRNIEIIIVDDGSIDDTFKIAESYAENDARIKIFQKENGGVSSARNMGIRESNGEYIIFLDSDDWLEDDAIEFLLDLQINNHNRLITAEFRTVKEYVPVTSRETDDDILTLNSIDEALNLSVLQYIHSKLFRTDIIRTNNIAFREGINYGEDAVFVFDCLHRTEGVIYSPRIIMSMLERSDSATGKPYEQRKLFQDYPQLMIDHPDNTEAIIKKLRAYHTEMFINELSNALASKADTDTITYLRGKTKLYLNEYLNGKSLTRKAAFYFKLYMPVNIVRVLQRTSNLIRRLIPSRKI